MPKVVVSRSFVAYLISFLSAAQLAPFYQFLDPRVFSRANNYFAFGLATLSKATDNDLSAYVHFKGTSLYRRFQPVGSPDRAEEVPQEGAGAREGAGTEDAEERSVVISDAKASDDLRHSEMHSDFRSCYMLSTMLSSMPCCLI